MKETVINWRRGSTSMATGTEEMELRLQKEGWHVKHDAISEMMEQLREEAHHHHHNHSVDPLYKALFDELLDTDLRSVGLPSLPDSSTIQRVSKLQGPLILQVVSVRNISQSSSKLHTSTGEEQSHGRLLRIALTDGHSVVSALEYHAMPKFSLTTTPGTKVSIKNVITVQNGFLLGDANSITILGGHVEALYQAWEIERKYSGLARMGLSKTDRSEGVDGPPLFHGLAIPKHEKPNRGEEAVRVERLKGGIQVDSGVSTSRSKEKERDRIKDSYQQVNSGSSTSMVSTSYKSEEEGDLQKDGNLVPLQGKKIDVRSDAIKAAMVQGVDLVVPLQNRGAAQKLLERRNDKNVGDGHGRGSRGRGRGRGRRERYNHEDTSTLTLDEWEAQRIRPNLLVDQSPSILDDESLARQLHHQLNVMEINEVANTRDGSNIADQIRESMFSFSGDKNLDDYGSGSRHRGRGRGRGRARGRGVRHG